VRVKFGAVPETVQIDVVVEVMVTLSPDEAVAVTATVPVESD